MVPADYWAPIVAYRYRDEQVLYIYIRKYLKYLFIFYKRLYWKVSGRQGVGHLKNTHILYKIKFTPLMHHTFISVSQYSPGMPYTLVIVCSSNGLLPVGCQPNFFSSVGPKDLQQNEYI